MAKRTCCTVLFLFVALCFFGQCSAQEHVFYEQFLWANQTNANLWLLRVLNDDEAQKEIGLTEEQAKKLKSIKAKYKEDWDDIVEQSARDVSHLSDDEQIEWNRRVDEATETIPTQRDYNSILVLDTEQQHRFRQIFTQQRLGGLSSFAFYGHFQYQDLLGATDTERRKLDEATAAATKEFLTNYVELNEKYYQKLLESADAKVQEKMREQIGDIWFGFETETIKKEGKK